MNEHDDLEINILLRNNTPVDDFLGLSPAEMYDLMYDTFGEKSPVQLHSEIDNDVLDQIPLFRIVEEYLGIILRDNHIKLTPLGALPKKIMVELYDKGFLLDERIESGITKLWREDDCRAIKSARITAEIAGLVKKVNNKLTLTKTAVKLLETKNRIALFKRFFQVFTNKFNWSYNDGFPEQPAGQLGWAFSIYMLAKFGDEPRLATFYAEKYLKAFPNFIEYFTSGYSSPERMFYHCYSFRTFERFLLWFGFVTFDHKKKYSDLETDLCTRTNLISSVFKIDFD